MSKLRKVITSIAPGVFIIGYVVGTGSVTTLASSGAKYGMSMTWALALSCFFTYVLLVSISRLTILTGETLIHLIRTKYGSAAAIIIIAGLMITVVSSVIGVTAIASDVFREWTRMLSPRGEGLHPAFTAVIMITILCYLFWFGKHRFFMRAMSVIVALMGISFIGSMFMVIPDPSEILKGMVPRIPEGTDSHLILAGLVGTTMAAVVLVSRTYLVAEQKWTLEDLKVENRDASVSLVLTFLVSASILATAAGTMYPRGIIVDRAIDMVKTLEPIAGPLAASVFVLGIMAAAFSSLFPNYLLGPWLLFDFRNRPRKMNRTAVRFTVLGVALLGLIVPLFKGNPVIIMIASQAVSPVMMPLLILFVFLLINNRRIVGDYKNPLIMNIGLGLTFLFSLFMAYTAYIGLSGFLSGG